MIGFVIAGTDTTALLIAQLVRHLLSQPALWSTLRDDRSLIANAVEEGVRLFSPARCGIRVVTRDVTIAGVSIPQGAKVVHWLASGNRDESRFPDPETFDPLREANLRHLGFGASRHFCLGAPLAALEARIALEALMDRIPEPRLPEQDWVYEPNLITPALRAVHIAWG